jgi:hypothetical protein
MLGQLIFAIGLVTTVGLLTGCFQVPKDLVSSPLQERIKHTQEKIEAYFNSLTSNDGQ